MKLSSSLSSSSGCAAAAVADSKPNLPMLGQSGDILDSQLLKPLSTMLAAMRPRITLQRAVKEAWHHVAIL